MWANVGPTPILSSRRWVNVSPTYICIWVKMGQRIYEYFNVYIFLSDTEEMGVRAWFTRRLGLRRRALPSALRVTSFFLASCVCMFVYVTMSSLVLVVPHGTDGTEACQPRHSSSVGPFSKHMHQVWDGEIPPRYKKFSEGCKKLNPSYNYTVWSDNDIIHFFKRKYPWFLPIYYKYTAPISKYDAVRFFILYEYGGIYFDLDIECRSPFDNILKVNDSIDAILRPAEPFGTTNNFMIARQHSPFMEYLMHGLAASQRSYGAPYLTVMLSAGPLYMVRRYNSYPCKESVLMLDDAKTYNLVLHHNSSSWHDWDAPFVFWMYSHLSIVLPTIALSPIIVLVLVAYWCHKRVVTPWRQQQRLGTKSATIWLKSYRVAVYITG